MMMMMMMMMMMIRVVAYGSCLLSNAQVLKGNKLSLITLKHALSITFQRLYIFLQLFITT